MKFLTFWRSGPSAPPAHIIHFARLVHSRRKKSNWTGPGQTNGTFWKHTHTHTLTGERNNERPGKIFITFRLAFPFTGKILEIFSFQSHLGIFFFFFVSCSPAICVCVCVRTRLSGAFDCLLSNCPEANVLTRRCPSVHGLSKRAEDAQPRVPGWIRSRCLAVAPCVWITLPTGSDGASINLLSGTLQGQRRVLQPSCFCASRPSCLGEKDIYLSVHII